MDNIFNILLKKKKKKNNQDVHISKSSMRVSFRISDIYKPFIVYPNKIKPLFPLR